MKRVAALLRGVNVGGKKLPMADLKAVIAGLGWADPQTLLASGNAVFGAKGADSAIEEALEEALAAELKFKTEVMVRGHAELAAVMAANPFPDMARDDPSHLVVLFLKGQADAAKVKALPIPGREAVAVGDRCLYVAYPDGIGTSKLVLPETALGSKGTARNWNTVSKLCQMTAG